MKEQVESRSGTRRDIWMKFSPGGGEGYKYLRHESELGVIRISSDDLNDSGRPF